MFSNNFIFTFKTLSVIALCAFSVKSIASEPLAYKGIPLGITKTIFLKKLPQFKCLQPDGSSRIIEECEAQQQTYGDLKVDRVQASLIKGKLHAVAVIKNGPEVNKYISTWNGMLVHKYGLSKPTEITELEPYKFFSTIWERPDGEILLYRKIQKNELTEVVENIVITISDNVYQRALTKSFIEDATKSFPKPHDM